MGDAADLPTQDAALLHCLTRWPYSRLCPPKGALLDFSRINRDVLSLVKRQTTGAPSFFVAGGDNSLKRLDAVCSFDLGSASQQWKQLLPLSSGALSSHDSCMWRGQPLVVGGYYTCSSVTRHCHVYSHRDHAWSRAPNLQHSRGICTVVCAGEAVFACGGYIKTTLGNSMEVLGQRGWAWVDGPQMLYSRQNHCSSIIGGPGDAATATGFIIAGGSECIIPSPTCTEYDIESERWTRIADVIKAAKYDRAVTLADGCVYVTGQEGLQCYDHRANRWQLRSPMVNPVCIHAAARLEEHMIVVFGGHSLVTKSNSAVCQVYDSRADAWQHEERWTLPEALSGHTAVAMV